MSSIDSLAITFLPVVIVIVVSGVASIHSIKSQLIINSRSFNLVTLIINYIPSQDAAA